LSLPLLAVIAIAACGDSGGEDPRTPGSEPIHIHGLDINPGDGALFVATHIGLFKSSPDSTGLEPVGPLQDTMGFTVVGPDHFLASGHPPPGKTVSPHLGLIASNDAGESWEPVSLQGEADFHVLRFAHERVYAYEGLSQRLMVSEDAGKSWSETGTPSPVFDLAVSPNDAERLIVATEAGLLETKDTGQSWRRLSNAVGLLAWPKSSELYLIDGSGSVQLSRDDGHAWERRGDIGGRPVAFSASPEGDLYTALEDGSVVGSSDNGASWGLRVAP